jgi:hypothetical protein
VSVRQIAAACLIIIIVMPAAADAGVTKSVAAARAIATTDAATKTDSELA